MTHNKVKQLTIIAVVIIGLLAASGVVYFKQKEEGKQETKSAVVEQQTSDSSQASGSTSTTKVLNEATGKIDDNILIEAKNDIYNLSGTINDLNNQAINLSISYDNLCKIEQADVQYGEDQTALVPFQVILQQKDQIITVMVEGRFKYENSLWQRTALEIKGMKSVEKVSAYFAKQSAKELKIASVEASSVRESMGSNTYGPENLYDNKLNTAWVDGSPDDGKGDMLKIYLDGSKRVSYLKIFSGYHKSEKRYFQNHRPAMIKITTSNGAEYTRAIPDVMEPQLFYLGDVETEFVEFGILATYPGDELMDTCISEVDVYGN